MLVLDAPPHKTVGMAAGYKAERVRTLRKALGLDQKELAEAAGTDQGDISRIERGATKRATGVNAERKLALLAKALRVRWGGTAWPCEAVGAGGVVILGESDESR